MRKVHTENGKFAGVLGYEGGWFGWERKKTREKMQVGFNSGG